MSMSEMPSRSRIAPSTTRPAALRGLHDVVEEVVADDRPAFLLAEQIHDQHVARLQHVDRHLVVQPRQPGALAFALITPSRSGRSGMNCTVKARPTSFLPGCRTWKPSGVLVAEVLARQDREDFLGRQAPRPLDQRVGNLGPAVGKPLERVLRRELDHLILGQREQLRVREGRRQHGRDEDGQWPAIAGDSYP